MVKRVTVKSNVDSVERKYRKAREEATKAANKARLEESNRILEVAKSRTPYEEGDLKSMAFVDRKRDGSVEFGFKAPTPEGAIKLMRQHEDLSLLHPGQDSQTKDIGQAAQGQAKFMESAVAENKDQAEARIKAVFDETFERVWRSTT